MRRSDEEVSAARPDHSNREVRVREHEGYSLEFRFLLLSYNPRANALPASGI
jgi:hypothetical protein